MTVGRVTGLGSLPHTDPQQAAAFVAATAGVPYLAELPNRHPEEVAVVRWGDGLCGCGTVGSGPGLVFGADPGPRAEAHVGPETILGALGADTPRVVTFAVGPITLAAAMRAAGHPGGGRLWSEVVAGVSERIGAHLAVIADRIPDAEVIVMVDEPALAVEGSGAPEAVAALSAVLADLPVSSGIHCCGEWDPAAVARLRPDWLAFDTSAIGLAFADAAPDVAATVSAGTRIIWGVVPALPPPLPSIDELVARVRRAEGMLVLAGADLRRLDEALLAPACGLGGLTIDQASAVADRVIDVAGVLDG